MLRQAGLVQACQPQLAWRLIGRGLRTKGAILLISADARALWRRPGLANSGASWLWAVAGRQGRDCLSNTGVGSPGGGCQRREFHGRPVMDQRREQSRHGTADGEQAPACAIAPGSNENADSSQQTKKAGRSFQSAPPFLLKNLDQPLADISRLCEPVYNWRGRPIL